jgi:hypothetical protein
VSTNNISRWRLLLEEEDANILSHASLGAMISLIFVTDRWLDEELRSFNLSFVEPRSLLRGRNRSLPPNEEKAQQGQDGVGATACGPDFMLAEYSERIGGVHGPGYFRSTYLSRVRRIFKEKREERKIGRSNNNPKWPEHG